MKEYKKDVDALEALTPEQYRVTPGEWYRATRRRGVPG